MINAINLVPRVLFFSVRRVGETLGTRTQYHVKCVN